MWTSFLATILLLSIQSAHALSYTFTTIDVPGASITAPDSLNDAGQIVGSFLMPLAAMVFYTRAAHSRPLTSPAVSPRD